MTTLINNSKLHFLPIRVPRLGKGSHCAITLPLAIANGFIAGAENISLVELFHPESVATLADRSPIVLIGQNSTGKTMMGATLLSVWSEGATSDGVPKKLTLTSAIEFSRALTRAIKADDMPRFRQMHRDCDALLLDNIQEFAGKPIAQEEMLATLDHLISEGRCVVATASDLPLGLSGLNRSLQSRFSAGLSISLCPPGRQSRERLLSEIAQDAALGIEPGQIPPLADAYDEDPTAVELKGAIIRWSHQLRLNPAVAQRPEQAVDRLLDGTYPPALDPQDIAKTVCRESNVTLEQMKGPSRKSSIVRARGLAMFLIRQLTSESYESIGALFSDRDHTTVMNACKKTQIKLASDTDLSRIHDRIRQKFRRTR
jgi:chromosomal replication initiator protein